MLVAIDKMLEAAAAGRERFEADEMVQVWIVHHLEILGEAAASIPDELRAEHTEVPWHRIIGARNRLVHGYFDIDLGVVWEVVERELPGLREQIARILQGLDHGGKDE